MRSIPSLVLCFFLFTTQAQILIKNTNVLDVEKKKMFTHQSVVIKDGKIMAVDKNFHFKLPAGTTIIDGTDKYLIPGFVDAHVHFFQSGGIYTRPDVIDLRKYRPYDKEIEWAHQNMEYFLRRYTRAGITTVIDVGATLHLLQQRDTFRNKLYAPNIYMTGPLLTTWEPEAYKNLGLDEPFFEMKTPEEARMYVQKQLLYKPDFIKVWYILDGPDKDSIARQRLPLVQAVVDEAHKDGLRVAVHATERITARLAVEAGADFLVHSIDDEPVDSAFVQLLKNKKVVLCPTLVVYDNYRKALGQEYNIAAHELRHAHPEPLNTMIDFQHFYDTAIANRARIGMKNAANRIAAQDSLMRSNLKKLLEGGVVIATGTDAGNIGTHHVSSYFDELAAMQQSGFNLWQLLQASTLNGAKVVGKESQLGSIKIGKTADLILLRANPLDSLANWQKIDWIIHKGIAFRPDSINVTTPELLVQQQLLAFNAHNLDAFIEPYAKDVEVYSFPQRLLTKGEDEMLGRYEFITQTPGLYSRLLHRIVQGDTIIDQQEVFGFGEKPVYGTVIYRIENNKIKRVYFIQ
ncbi:MAG: amidohydrolase family protein [Flavisolibacter sp.]|nr:amidohydrolase family protein [Flavisolibacter sp.]